MNTAIVILAAGESARMGVPKQLLAYRGKSLLRHAIDTALQIPGAPIVVVLGAHAGQIRAEIADSRVAVVENPGWREGMGGSLRTGLGASLAAQPALSAVLFLVCDQPLLSTTALEALIATHERTGCAVAASEYDGTLGVPALFSRTLFPELLALAGAAGAKEIIRRHREQAIAVPFHAGAIDIDTPADYSRLRGSPAELPALTSA
jgi:molybdenum cofactor cytidylyltransferase